ncbi:MAG: hypothetical protein ACTSU5_07505 [Promethearchaeota archaeon]
MKLSREMSSSEIVDEIQGILVEMLGTPERIARAGLLNRGIYLLSKAVESNKLTEHDSRAFCKSLEIGFKDKFAPKHWVHPHYEHYFLECLRTLLLGVPPSRSWRR